MLTFESHNCNKHWSWIHDSIFPSQMESEKNNLLLFFKSAAWGVPRGNELYMRASLIMWLVYNCVKLSYDVEDREIIDRCRYKLVGWLVIASWTKAIFLVPKTKFVVFLENEAWDRESNKEAKERFSVQCEK